MTKRKLTSFGRWDQVRFIWERQETSLLTKEAAVYWLVLFSIVFHGLSIPVNNLIYKVIGVSPMVDKEGPTEVRRLSRTMSLPKNSSIDPRRRDSVTVYNRFSRPNTSEGVSSWSLPARTSAQEAYEISEMRREPTIQFVDNSDRV